MFYTLLSACVKQNNLYNFKLCEKLVVNYSPQRRMAIKVINAKAYNVLPYVSTRYYKHPLVIQKALAISYLSFLLCSDLGYPLSVQIHSPKSNVEINITINMSCSEKKGNKSKHEGTSIVHTKYTGDSDTFDSIDNNTLLLPYLKLFSK